MIVKKVSLIKEVETIKEIDIDPKIKHLLFPSFVSVRTRSDEEYLNGNYFIVYDNEDIVGYYKIDFDFNDSYDKSIENKVWLSLAFKEQYRGKGYASDSLKEIEKILKEIGVEAIELGVFEFNKRAIKFYEKNGFKKIGEINDFTYYDKKFYKDIRYLKVLN